MAYPMESLAVCAASAVCDFGPVPEKPTEVSRTSFTDVWTARTVFYSEQRTVYFQSGMAAASAARCCKGGDRWRCWRRVFQTSGGSGWHYVRETRACYRATNVTDTAKPTARTNPKSKAPESGRRLLLTLRCISMDSDHGSGHRNRFLSLLGIASVRGDHRWNGARQRPRAGWTTGRDLLA